ncbi:MAG: hypothetical protein K1060chlam2_00886 [Chlamydiae bacterium]|nr:hypothetical protein [Chlamydiota bacterium]
MLGALSGFLLQSSGMFKMRTAIIALLGIVSLYATCYGEVRGAYFTHFAVELDYLYLKRDNSHNRHLAVAAGGPVNFPSSTQPSKCAKEEGKSLIDTRELIRDMDYNSGVSGAIKIFPSIKSTWEARYTGGFTWRGEETVNCVENLNIDGRYAFQTQDYNFANRVKAIYDSDLYTLELNYHRHVTPRYTDHFAVSWLLGLRYFKIDEKIKLYFTKTFPTLKTSRYRTRTENRTVGLQFGGCFEYNPYHFLTWGFVAKVAGLYGREEQHTLMGDQNNTLIFRNIHGRGSTFAYMGQFYPFIELRPSKHFFFIVNYQVLYIGNIATAPRNVRFHGSRSHLDQEGHILYHGVTGGIQFNF